MKRQSLIVVFMLSLSVVAGPPGEGVAAAATDAAKLPEEIRQHVRYLSLFGIPEKERELFRKVLAFHCNSLSRDPEIVLPALVSPDIVRVNLLDYGWNRDTWEKLAAQDVYFHAKIEKVALEVLPAPKDPKFIHEVTHRRRVSFDQGQTWVNQESTDGGKTWQREAEKQEVKVEKKEGKIITAHAPWLPPIEIAALALTTNSDAPILRADWFVYQTGGQIKRGGAGYYDFLGVKNVADLQKLVALDIEAAKRLRLEMAAIVSESGVALNNRQVLRLQGLTGPYWVTLDVEANEDKRNAVRLLNGDFKHEAEEIYATLPNRLFAFAAASAKGDLQDFVPDNIASDHVAPSNDRRIEPGIGCIRCHEEGLKPIDDWARKVYRGPLQLTSPDYLKLKRLRQLYLSDLPGQLTDDVAVYAKTLKLVNGLAPKANSQAYARSWQRYAYTSLGLDETAYELGTDAKTWKTALEIYGKAGTADPVLMGLLATPPARIRREHWREVYSLAHTVLRGVRP